MQWNGGKPSLPVVMHPTDGLQVNNTKAPQARAQPPAAGNRSPSTQHRCWGQPTFRWSRYRQLKTRTDRRWISNPDPKEYD